MPRGRPKKDAANATAIRSKTSKGNGRTLP
jgi:hypothetical protein